MDLRTFIEQSEPEVLQKLAAEAQDELVNKVVEAIFPLFEKTAAYTAFLVLEKLAEEIKEEAPKENEATQEVEEAVEAQDQNAEVTAKVNEIAHTDPAAGNKTNQSMDPSVTPGGLKAQDIKDACSEAIQVGQAEKILPFVKAIASQYPETINEVIKMVKVELHDGIMKKLVDEETAVKITDELNAMVGGV
jgi:hypothetical protein